MRHTAHFVRDSAVQTEPTVWVPVIAEQKFALQERRYITGKNCISGKDGSGAVFCRMCFGLCFLPKSRNQQVCSGESAYSWSACRCLLRLQEQNANNINLVTGSHFTPWIVQALELTKPKMHIPVVWNCGGYESLEILHMLDGLVDIYLPDLKFYTAETAKAYANCPDYFSVASKAILEMYRQVEALSWNGDLLERGLMVRHLVLPGHRKESMQILDWLADALPKADFC